MGGSELSGVRRSCTTRRSAPSSASKQACEKTLPSLRVSTARSSTSHQTNRGRRTARPITSSWLPGKGEG